MKNKIKLLMAMLLFFGITNAQGSQDEYNKAVDYCTYKIAYAYTNQYANIKNGSKESESFKNRIKPKLDSYSIENPISNLDLSDLLTTNNFETFGPQIISAAKKSKDSFDETFDKEKSIEAILYGFYANDSELNPVVAKFSDVAGLKATLQREIALALNSFDSDDKVETSIPINTDSNVEALQQKIINLEKEISIAKSIIPNWLSITLIFSSLLLSLFTLFILVRKTNSFNNMEERIARHRLEIDKLKPNQPQNTRNTSNDTNTTKEIEKIQRDILNLQNTMDKYTSTQKHQISSSHQVDIRQNKQKREILYAPAPDKDGSFKVSVVVASENQNSSFYKFTLVSNNKAEFELITSERALMDALGSYQLILQPVCKFLNTVNQNAKRIRTVKEGIVVKENDKWILDTKAEIRYE